MVDGTLGVSSRTFGDVGHTHISEVAIFSKPAAYLSHVHGNNHCFLLNRRKQGMTDFGMRFALIRHNSGSEDVAKSDAGLYI